MKSFLEDLAMAVLTVILAAVLITVICVIDEFMSWECVIVLISVLLTSWKVGQPLIRRREMKKQRETRETHSRWK